MNTEDIQAWLHLFKAPGLGVVKISSLLAEFEQASNVLKQKSFDKHHQIPAKALRYIQQANTDDIATELSWLEKDNNYLLVFDDPLYPPQLKQIDDPPLLLFVKGQPEVLLLPQLAVVGSRHATRGGLENTQSFCSDLVNKGWVITSGLAAGIDSAAHQAAINENGQTVAVMGTGINQIYPAHNQALAKSIIKNGAVVSEFPINTPPNAHNFPRRNRIIAGLSLGTLVIEAAKKSGTLITARQAMEQGRPVMAIPGSIHNPLVKGCHLLIKQGAKLVESATDIEEELTPSITMLSNQIQQQLDQSSSIKKTVTVEKSNQNHTSGLSSTEQQVIDTMGFDPITFDDLVHETSLNSADLSAVMLALELSNWVEVLPGTRYQRLK